MVIVLFLVNSDEKVMIFTNNSVLKELKTPLTVILGYLEIMRLNYMDDEMLKKVEAKAKLVFTKLAIYLCIFIGKKLWECL